MQSLIFFLFLRTPPPPPSPQYPLDLSHNLGGYQIHLQRFFCEAGLDTHPTNAKKILIVFDDTLLDQEKLLK